MSPLVVWSALLVGFGSITICSWMARRRRIAVPVPHDRYATLFGRVPIALLREDFSRLGVHLDRLRRKGVTDIRRYLAENPSEVRRLVDLVEIIDVNEAAVALLAAESKEQLLGDIPEASMTDETDQALIEEIVAIWEGKEMIEIEVVGSTLTGDRLDVVLRWSAPVCEERLDLSDVTVAVTDVTAQKRAAEQLQNLIQTKDDFIATVSHELRTPLTGIVGFLSVLQDPPHEFTTDELHEVLDIVAHEARDLSSIVDDLLVVGRAEVGTLQLGSERVDVKEQLSQVMAASFGRDEVRLAEIPEEPAIAFGDPARIRQILRNLLSNAIRYGGDDVWVRLLTTPTDVRVLVCDDGDGVLPDEQARIFDAHYSPEASTSAQPMALGLGLSVARRLARAMGGDVMYRREGHTVFDVALPNADDPRRRPVPDRRSFALDHTRERVPSI